MSTASAIAPPAPDIDGPDLPDLFEVVDGRIVEPPPMSIQAQVIGSRLARYLSVYGDEHDLGEAPAEVLFRLALPVDRIRRPDAAFVPFTEWPRGRPLPSHNGWTARPSLCVEVVSPTDRAEEVREKVDEYLRAGVAAVWVVYPQLPAVDVYEPDGRFRTVGPAGELDGGAAVPGFRLPMSTLFPPPPPAAG